LGKKKGKNHRRKKSWQGKPSLSSRSGYATGWQVPDSGELG